MTLPLLANSNNPSTKDLIINSLTQEWPLTTKQIFERVRRGKETGVSYQAVHKVIKQLAEGNVIERTEKGYKLNKDWINEMKKFSENLKEIYSSKNATVEIATRIVFNRFMDFALFLVDDYFLKYPNPENKAGICFWNHVYGLFGISETQCHNLSMLFSQGDYYSICPNNTFLDKHFAKYLEKMGKKCLNGASYLPQADTFVQGEYVCQAFFPYEFVKYLDELYKRVQSIEELDMQEYLSNIMHKKRKIDVLIFKDCELAEKLRREVNELYSKNVKKEAI